MGWSGGNVENEHPTEPFATAAAAQASTHAPFAQPWSGPHSVTTSSVHPSTTFFRSREQRSPAHDAGSSGGPASVETSSLGGSASNARSVPPHEASAETTKTNPIETKAMSEVELPDPTGPWLDVVAAIMRSYRRSYARYPRLIPLLTAYPVTSEQAITMYNALARTLTEAGFDPGDTLRIITLIDSFVLGSALDAAAPAAPWGASPDVGPELAAALDTGADKADRAGDAFEFGLEVLLRGLSAL